MQIIVSNVYLIKNYLTFAQILILIIQWKVHLKKIYIKRINNAD